MQGAFVAKKQAGTPASGPTVPRNVARKMLIDLRDKAKHLLANRPISSAQNQAWETVAQDYLSQSFGEGSPNVASVMDVGKFSNYFGGGNEQTWEADRAKDLTDRLVIIEALIDMVEADMKMRAGPEAVDAPPPGNRVFLVHGHDELAIHETARFLEKLKLEVVILREQPNKGRTIIEKIHDYSDVAFAVVLLTPDDRGGTAKSEYANQKPRARQNVILELGFFLGVLSRNRVCVLYHQGVEIPSDYSGVLFVEVDNSGAWKMLLAKEMKAAELQIDMNDAVS